MANRDYRVLGSTWFLLLAFLQAYALLRGGHDLPWPHVIASICLVVFYVILWFLIATRPPAKAKATGWLPRISAFVGTYMPWTISLLAPDRHAATNVASAVLILIGMVLMLVTVSCLGRSFSIVPQARAIAHTGPYRWIRHPLYLAEEIALAGVVLQYLSPVTVAIFIAHICVQLSRTFWEEKLLRASLPGYDAYAATRWRLIPLVW